MKLIIDNMGLFRFWFEHLTGSLLLTGDGTPVPARTLVSCSVDESTEFSGREITRFTEDKEIFRDCAICAPSDQYVKAKGRRVALAHLLMHGLRRGPDVVFTFTPEDRKKIWAEYFRNHSDLRKK